MPAETHQRGAVATVEEVVNLLAALLGDRAADAPDETTLADLGVTDDEALADLWDEVRSELGERSLGPAEGADELGVAMTVARAAATMSGLLSRDRAGGGGDGDVEMDDPTGE